MKEWETRDKEVRGLAKTAAEEKREMLRLQRIAAEVSTGRGHKLHRERRWVKQVDVVFDAGST